MQRPTRINAERGDLAAKAIAGKQKRPARAQNQPKAAARRSVGEWRAVNGCKCPGITQA